LRLYSQQINPPNLGAELPVMVSSLLRAPTPPRPPHGGGKVQKITNFFFGGVGKEKKRKKENRFQKVRTDFLRRGRSRLVILLFSMRAAHTRTAVQSASAMSISEYSAEENIRRAEARRDLACVSWHHNTIHFVTCALGLL
jgi:hypothetical protein